jgi:hypothetical protein
MTTRPYELLARFAPNGTVAGVSVRTITTVNGRDFEGDPQPLSGTGDAAFAAFADQFAAAVVSERDTAVAALETQRATMQAEIDRLTALIPPPLPERSIYPRELLGRLTMAEVVAAIRSDDDAVIFAVANLQTTVSPVLLDAPETQMLIGSLVQAGILTPERMAEVLA